MPLNQAETYPLTDPSFLEEPYPVYRRMRQQDPVYWSDALGHWVLTRYDDVLAATRHPALSSARTEVFVRAQLRGSDPALVAPAFAPNSQYVVFISDRHGKPAIYWIAVDKLVSETDGS